MRSRVARPLTLLLFTISLSTSSGARAEPDWSRFRGPNGSGISTASNVPIAFGPQKNLVWRLTLPGGHSSLGHPERTVAKKNETATAKERAST
jgi:hypothetical protein